MSLLAPSIVLSAAIASAYATLFNLWRNGTPRDMLFHMVASWTGFALGQIGGWLFHIDWGMIGSVYLVEGTVFSWLLLFLMAWLRIPRQR